MSAPRSNMRRHRRFIVDLQTEAAGTWLRDISMRGMKILSKHALRIDEAVETGLNTAHGVLHLKGRVVRACRSGVHTQPFEYGIELEPLAAADDLRLRRYLDELSREAEVAPENPVDPLDLQRLHDRIEELEMALGNRAAASGPNARRGPDAGGTVDERLAGSSTRQKMQERDNPSGTPSDERLATAFDWLRFSHLVRLGQPLLASPALDAAAIVGELTRMVASQGSSCFDLNDVQGELGAFVDEEKLVTELFELYQGGRIDFA